MTITNKGKTKTKIQLELRDALRAYERAHNRFMQTTIFDKEYGRVRTHLVVALKRYIAAYKAANPLRRGWLRVRGRN